MCEGVKLVSEGKNLKEIIVCFDEMKKMMDVYFVVDDLYYL